MISLLVPLYYQLLSAYRPQPLTPSASISQEVTIGFNLPSTTPTSTPIPSKLPSTGTVLGASVAVIPAFISTPTPTPTLPPIGGEEPVLTIALLGDSMIDTLGTGAPALQTALSRYYPGRKFRIFNYGVGASHIEYALYRLTQDYDYDGQHYPSLISRKPDIIIIESFAYNNFGNTQEGIDRQWLNLGAITSTIREMLPNTKIVLTAVPAPNSRNFASGAPGINLNVLDQQEKTKTIKIYLQNLVNFATSQRYPLANAYTPSLTTQGEGLPDLISETDHLHLSDLGLQFLSDTIASTLHTKKIIGQ